MKQPTPSDFIVNVKEGSVSVIFKPSNSDYNFGRLADPEDIARYGVNRRPIGTPDRHPKGALTQCWCIRDQLALSIRA